VLESQVQFNGLAAQLAESALEEQLVGIPPPPPPQVTFVRYALQVGHTLPVGAYFVEVPGEYQVSVKDVADEAPQAF